MNTSPVNLRNLEQIHESSNSRSPRIATLLLAATGATAVLVVGLAMRDRSPATEPKEKDPLAALVADAEREKKEEGDVQLKADELNFPDVLSDADSRTTALVAVRDKSGKLLPPGEDEPLKPPPATDKIPVVPLPAGTLLAATPVTTDPKDELSQMALQVSRVAENAPLSPPGSDGGYLVQVASFKDQDDADQFVLDLRKRGHKAFRVAANVPGRGIWHRVRIGSFKTKYEADLYKKKLEETERTIALVIDPDKVERQEQIRAAKLAERIRKYGSE
jgi:cell division septation protein DedD